MPPRRRRAALALSGLAAGLLALGAVGCGRHRDPDRPDVILIVVDTLRADHLGMYGYARPTSPRLDALARRATVFDAAWSAAPWTLPSIMSIMTSRYPSGHRVENDGLRLADGTPTLAETMRGRGYSTGGFVSHVYVSATFGFARGFDRFEDFGLSGPGYRLEARMEPDAARVTDRALEWLGEQRDRPAFLFVHYFDPHWPYDPPAEYRDRFPSRYAGPLDASFDSIARFQDPLVDIPDDYRRFLIDRYDGEIAYTDAQIGRLLDGAAAARGAGAWVVVTADHGEEFKDHGSMGHGRRLYEEAIRVPLLIGRLEGAQGAAAGAAPPSGEGAGRRVGVPVSGIDLFPTIAALAGAAAPPGVQGKSLAGLLDPAAGGAARVAAAGGDAPPSPDRPLVSETVRLNAIRRAVRRGPLKLIRSAGEEGIELFDLAADPGEKRDRARDRPGDCLDLTRALSGEVDLLSGGWNLRWGGAGHHRFQGQVKTSGIFRSIIPVARDGVKYMTQAGNVLTFDARGDGEESGLTFTTAPYEASVEFYLLIDGRPLAEKIVLGDKRVHPRSLPFTLAGAAVSASAFARPPHPVPRELGYDLWRIRPAGPDQKVVLDDEIRERLRSLGYVN